MQIQGVYEGKVLSVDSPNKDGSVQVQVYNLHSADLGSNYPWIKVIYQSSGAFVKPKVGDIGMVLVINKRPENMYYLGSKYFNNAPENSEEVIWSDGDLSIKATKGKEIILKNKDTQLVVTPSAVSMSSGGSSAIKTEGGNIKIENGTSRITITESTISLDADYININRRRGY